MTDYIDREALRTTYAKWRNIQAKIDDDYGYGLMDDVLLELDAQPTVDVAPVVRCKNCKYSTDYCTPLWCKKLKMEIGPGFYCGFGEKYEWCNGMADMIILGTKTDEERDFYRGIQNEEEK